MAVIHRKIINEKHEEASNVVCQILSSLISNIQWDSTPADEIEAAEVAKDKLNSIISMLDQTNSVMIDYLAKGKERKMNEDTIKPRDVEHWQMLHI